MFKKTKDNALPRLAWIAEYNPLDRYLLVNYGQDVEVGDNFLVEGVWEGNFEEQGFDTSNHFFGSGLKLSNDKLVVSPSTGLVDRIFIGESKDKYYISNSLIEILAITKSKLLDDHNYKLQTNTIRDGVRQYTPDFPISSQVITGLKQYFYNPITIDTKGISITKRPESPSFYSYEQYISIIESDLKKISLNAASPLRKKPIDLYTTISKGYDSSAITALVANLPIKSAFTSKTSNSSVIGFLYKKWNDDDGTDIAEKLGLKVNYLDFKDCEIDIDELYFIAATTGEPELQLYNLHKLLGRNYNPSVIFTGYHGDTVWALYPPVKALTDDILKPGASGLTLSEARLKSGFIDAPIPMMYARSIVSINNLSTSHKMSEWSIGGEYDRPIPRRILESRGIGRTEFGMKKRAVATFYDLPKNKILRDEFLNYMKEKHNQSETNIMLSRIKDRFRYYIKMMLYMFDRSILKMSKFKIPLNEHTIDTPYHMHIWSLTKLVEERTKNLDL
ncbi:hypothetical protein [Marinobacter sp. F3R11]|uniref:hypothetical protein n=1 Tax=Marinobacter sp. F3R11 TaxID=2267231 RepID=UPI000DE802AD|nr:hypothetical protein [Marinobacter sp. F3R11]RBW49718.1 hypothetical protein DS878_05080 [Marinobacter sp. F3R11]